MTLIVNLYGGPGTGKSTTAALTFGKLKDAGVNCELVTEYAKELVWEGREIYQPYVFGKQWMKIQRLQGKVDVAISDSPIMLTAIYGEELGERWIDCVRMFNEGMDRFDVYLERNNEAHPYNPAGRYQKNVREAIAVDGRIEFMLAEERFMYHRVPILGASDTITQMVLDELHEDRVGVPHQVLKNAEEVSRGWAICGEQEGDR